jgi:hypothetical protein
MVMVLMVRSFLWSRFRNRAHKIGTITIKGIMRFKTFPPQHYYHYNLLVGFLNPKRGL